MSKFKQYYDNPEYKARTVAKQKEIIVCPDCGASVARGSYYLHRSSNKHKMDSKKKSERVIELEKERDEIERIYNKKIRAMKRKKEQILENIDTRIDNINL